MRGQIIAIINLVGLIIAIIIFNGAMPRRPPLNAETASPKKAFKDHDILLRNAETENTNRKDALGDLQGLLDVASRGIERREAADAAVDRTSDPAPQKRLDELLRTSCDNNKEANTELTELRLEMAPQIKKGEAMALEATEALEGSLRLVFEGERAMTKGGGIFGKFHLDGIPPTPHGVPQIVARPAARVVWANLAADDSDEEIEMDYFRNSMGPVENPDEAGGFIILADPSHCEAASAAHMLEKVLLPLRGNGAEKAPRVLSASDEVPLGAKKVLVACSNECFKNAPLIRQILQASENECHMIPVVAEDAFRFPTQDFWDVMKKDFPTLMEEVGRDDVHCDTLIAVIQGIFSELSETMVQDTLRWIPSNSIGKFPPDVDMKIPDTVTTHLTDSKQDGVVLITDDASQHSKAKREAVILADPSHCEATSAAHLLEKLLLPFCGNDAGRAPRVLSASDEVPLGTKKVLIVCSNECFKNAPLIRQILQASEN